jgi:hypothetical protein
VELVEYPSRYSKKNVELASSFVELDVFGTVELERSWKNGSRAVPNTPLVMPNPKFRSCKITLFPQVFVNDVLPEIYHREY